MDDSVFAVQILFAALTGMYISEKGWGMKEIFILNIGFAFMLRGGLLLSR